MTRPRIDFDIEADELGRYFHAKCTGCGDYRDFDHEGQAEDYRDTHECLFDAADIVTPHTISWRFVASQLAYLVACGDCGDFRVFDRPRGVQDWSDHHECIAGTGAAAFAGSETR